MPRLPRKYNNIGIYHIMVRGNAKQNIFIDNQDKRKFIKTIIQNRNKGLLAIYAFCIMNNHAHLVVKELSESVSKFMKRITVSYAFYFNAKYDRVGHVFQDRFKSEAIKDDRHLLSTIKYVHNNPEKSGITSKYKYPWSSYNEYISTNNSLTEVKEILGIFSSNIDESIVMFKYFSEQIDKTKRKYLEIEENNNKEFLVKYIKKYLKENNIEKKDLKDRKFVEYRNSLVKNIAKKYNFSTRTIAEVTEINRETIRRLSKEPSP